MILLDSDQFSVWQYADDQRAIALRARLEASID
jgi:hypothetical protein